MDHRYNYFHQNPNALVNGQPAYDGRPTADGTRPTDDRSESISSTSSQDQSPFHERRHLNPNTVPLMNNQYQMDYSNQPPRSSGPPRTNAKGIYDNSQSSISNVSSLAQSNAENYPTNPDFQLQPHLTGFLPQQPKGVPKLYPVDNYSTNRGSITENMNTNYFSSNKSYPEPKIIEYDVEETSTESSPQHTSSLYSESTDQDSECTHPNNVFTRFTSNRNTECHVTKESKPITSSNNEFPVPRQFADLNFNRNDTIDDHQHSILHSAYQDDDIIEDIPLSDNITQNETLENQENPEFQYNEQSTNLPRAQTFDNCVSKKDLVNTEFNYDNKLSSSSYFNNTSSYSSFNVTNSSNIQNPSQFNEGSYFSQSNMLTQPSSNSSLPDLSQNKPLFSYNNTNLLNSQQGYKKFQNDDLLSGNYSQQNKHNIQSAIQDSNLPSIDSKPQCNVNSSNIQENTKLNQPTSQTQILDNQGSDQYLDSNTVNSYNQQNISNIESTNQQSVNNCSKSAPELLNTNPSKTSQNVTDYNNSITSTDFTDPTLKSSTISEALVQENQKLSYQTPDDQTSHLLSLSNSAKSSSIDLINQDSKNIVTSELNVQFSQSPSINIIENQQEIMVDKSTPINMLINESQKNNEKISSPPPITNLTESNNFTNSKSITPQSTSQQSITDDDIKTPNNLIKQSMSSQGYNISNYFNSINVNNQPVFNQRSQSSLTQNEQHVPTQDIDSNVQNTNVNIFSSNQQQSSIDNLNLDPNMSSNSQHSTESIMTQVHNLNVKANTEIITVNSKIPDNITPNVQFSNMTIDDQQNMPIHQTLKLEQTTSLDTENNFFKDVSSNANNTINNLAPEVSDAINSSSQFVSSTLINTLPVNNHSTIHKSHQLTNMTNQTDIKSNVQSEVNYLPHQQLVDKATPNIITSISTTMDPQFSNQQKLDAIPSLTSATNQYSTQSFSQQFTPNVVQYIPSVSNPLQSHMFNNQPKVDIDVPIKSTPSLNPSTQSTPSITLPVSSESNQFPSQVLNNQLNLETVPPVQSISNPYGTQSFNNQSTPTVNPISVNINQFPAQKFSNNLKTNTVSSLPSLSSHPTQPLNTQPLPSVVSSVQSIFNQFPQQALSNLEAVPAVQSISSPYAIQPLNNQSTSTTVKPVTTTINQVPPQMFRNQPKENNVLPLQSTSSSYPTQPFNTHPISSTASSTSYQFPLQMLSNQPKLETILPGQSISNHITQPISTTVTSVSSNINQLPQQIFGNQSKLSSVPLLSNTTNQYPSKSFSNQSSSNIVPPISSNTNQNPPPIFNSSAKSEIIPPLHSAINENLAQTSFSNQPTVNTVLPISTTNQFPPQMVSNQSKTDFPLFQTMPSQHPSQSYNNHQRSSIAPPDSLAANQFPPQMLKSQPETNSVDTTQSVSNQYPSQIPNNQPILNMNPTVSSIENKFPPQMLSNQPKLDAHPSNKLSAYPSQLISNQPTPGISSIQHTTNPFQSQPFNSEPNKPNLFSPQLVTNKYPLQPFSNQPSQQVVSNQLPPSNQLYNHTNIVQPSKWPPQPNTHQTIQQSTTPLLNTNFTNQINPMFSQQKSMNSSSNVYPSANQQSVGTQRLPPNPLTSNNYNNQVQGNGNVQQSQPLPPLLPGQNVQLTQQNTIGVSNQINYQQPNVNYGQQGFHSQQQNSSVVQDGFAKTWGYDNLDLLRSRDILPSDGVQPPEIKLPQGYANCDNCSPDIFRCTLNKFPSSKNLLDKSRLPLGILIHPYKDLSRLTVIQCETITRCRNCRSYINPFVQFIDNAHWKCNLCYRVNELPGEFQIDPYTKTLGDPSRRPEIQNATIEYIASQDYMVRPPQPALYLFLLDVSRTATLTGYLEIVCDRILNKILGDEIPGDSRTNVGFITYDSSVHFYQIANSDGGQPKQLIVSDISDIFLPLPDGLMVNLEENKSAIKDLLTSLPNFYRESYNTGCALGAALQAAFKILAPRGGRVTVFQACLPNSGPGSLQPRDDGKPHTGDRVQHMTPSTDFYKKLALECSAEQIAVDMFFVSSQYLDIATISGISKYSGGCIHSFPQFDVKSPTIVTRFINCFDRYLSRKIGFEALLRLRCTRGVAIHSFHGNFFVRSSDLLMLPNVNPDNAYGMQLSIEDSLEGIPVVCFQAALLYTSSNAERRIRVHTLCIPVTDNLNDVFHNADQQAITCLIAKMAVDRSTEKSLSDAREAFFNAISDSLSAFKLGCSSYSGSGTMLSPLSLKVFPLYILATLKHAAFRTNQPTRLDERMFSMCQMKSLPLNNLIQYIYPDLYPIHALEEQPKINYEKLTEIPLPPVIQLSAERIESNRIYLLDDSETLIIFVGHKCSDYLIQNLFGYVNVNSMPELITSLTEVDSKPSYLLRSFISYLQHFKSYPLPIEIIKDNGPHKLRFYSRLVEDKFESSLSYYEFLQRLSQQVR